MLLAAVVLSCAAPVYAQAISQTPTSVGDHALGIPTDELDGLAIGHRASKLIGATVYNESGQKLGKVTDVVIKGDGTVSAAIVDVGAFLGVGKRQVAVSLRRLVSVKDKLTLQGATKESLMKVPEFQYNKETVVPA